MAQYLRNCHLQIKRAEVFPIEVDLLRTTMDYTHAHDFEDGYDDEEEENGGQNSKPEEGEGVDLVEESQDHNLIDTSWVLSRITNFTGIILRLVLRGL